ncbi:hypothetical protein BMF90_02875 [Serratia sp. OLHL2]|uniref:Uncharacterized protein n=1 Tax=Serratia marcescens TaxID=615 RepID=A0A5C7CEX7_SERMA|nr:MULTISPECIES: hypothetical protein [Serratia]MBF4186367.1 hypothetical protein [Serratia ureilytica]MBF8439482.1 hypothetical protein [Serratia ureilytica]MBF8443604.1 hypothetical protein [Serratia ureilytica]MBH2842864.1 hypothetical protein [Serratia marcescens]MBH2861752.1 hypothetical protein [Serratia marcescens]
MSKIVPNSGKAVSLRNTRTGAPWVGSFDYIRGRYRFEPVGNLRAIKRPFESLRIPPEFEPAGTH